MRVGILSSEADEVSSPKISVSRVFFYKDIRVQNVNLQYILFTERRITEHPFQLRPFMYNTNSLQTTSFKSTTFHKMSSLVNITKRPLFLFCN